MASTPNEAASAPTEQARSEEMRSEQAPVVPEVPFNAPHSIAIDSFSDDTNSHFDDELSDLTSLSSSVLEFEYENGRRYCSTSLVSILAQPLPLILGLAHQLIHKMPNDEEEQDRMDLTHHIWLMLLGGELYNAPIKSSPDNILDLGTGTGIWALDIAEKFPNAHVIGNDISPIQPSWVAPNIEFIVEDFESEWQFEQNYFDFVHARCLAGCVADWPGFLRRIYDHVKPGGYFESHESAVWARSDDGSLKQDSALMQWQQAINIAGDKSGRELNIYYKLKEWMVAAGFEDVTLSVYVLPFSPWPRDPSLKALGKYQAVQLQQAIDSYSLRLYTQVLGWSPDVAQIHNALVKQELRDKKLHAYVETYSQPSPHEWPEYPY
ncbi:hypothetical protein N7504_010853 [Penicillium tannophilum]|nr:hypothetical protein N7504_010853 [Penicillium tannophilum]